MSAFVTGLATAAIKGTRLRTVPEIELGPAGARGDRAFYVIDERGRMVNGKQFGELQTVLADYDVDGGELTLTLAAGEPVRADVQYGGWVPTRFFSSALEARLVVGPWAEALSEVVGQPVRVVATDSAVDRGTAGAVSLISRASLRRLADAAAEEAVDARRFRMLIEVDGIGAHEEDSWVGRRVRVGSTLLAMRGHVGRCLVTSRDPETGLIDLPTLDLLGAYRRELESTEPLPFGVHGEVLEPGRVRVGDEVTGPE